ncbi:MAG: hypothetical protein WAV46_02000 [Candidatus Moraniibacteriota bacterium]
MNASYEGVWYSPGQLFCELGVERLYVYRPRRPLDRSVVLDIIELDENIRNYGLAFLFLPMENGALEPIVFCENDTEQSVCLFLTFDYTEGKFFFGLRAKGGNEVVSRTLLEMRFKCRALSFERDTFFLFPS